MRMTNIFLFMAVMALILVMFAPRLEAVPVYDQKGGGSGNGTAVSVAANITAKYSQELFVAIAWQGITTTAASVQYNSVAMSGGSGTNLTKCASAESLAIYYLQNPTTGSSLNIVATLSSPQKWDLNFAVFDTANGIGNSAVGTGAATSFTWSSGAFQSTTSMLYGAGALTATASTTLVTAGSETQLTTTLETSNVVRLTDFYWAEGKQTPVNVTLTAATSKSESGLVAEILSANTPTFTVTKTITQTITQTITSTFTVTQSITPTFSVTPTATPTFSITQTITPTFTVTPSITQSNTRSVTQTITQSITQTNTQSITQTITPTITSTFTVTPSNTQSVTQTITQTVTPSITSSVTPSITPSTTPTFTVTATITPTVTPTITPTFTISATITPTVTRVFSIPYPVPTPDYTNDITYNLTVSGASGVTTFPQIDYSIYPLQNSTYWEYSNGTFTGVIRVPKQYAYSLAPVATQWITGGLGDMAMGQQMAIPTATITVTPTVPK